MESGVEKRKRGDVMLADGTGVRRCDALRRHPRVRLAAVRVCAAVAVWVQVQMQAADVGVCVWVYGRVGRKAALMAEVSRLERRRGLMQTRDAAYV